MALKESEAKVQLYAAILIRLAESTKAEDNAAILGALRSCSHPQEILEHLETWGGKARRTVIDGDIVTHDNDMAHDKSSPMSTTQSLSPPGSPFITQRGTSHSRAIRRAGWHPTLQPDAASTAQAEAARDAQYGTGQQWLVTRGDVELYGILPYSCVVLAGGYPTVEAPLTLPANLIVPEYLIQPRHEVEDCPMSSVYVQYLNSARAYMKRGGSASDILGPDSISVAHQSGSGEFSAVRFVSMPSGPHTVVHWACEMTNGYHEIDTHVRLALTFLYTRLMRVRNLDETQDQVLEGPLLTFSQWMICPSEETYAQVPEVIRPTPGQKMIPHSPMVDLAIT